LWQVLTWMAPLLGTTTSQLWRNATPGAGAIHTINQDGLLETQGAAQKEGRAILRRFMQRAQGHMRPVRPPPVQKLLQSRRI
ncbi:hypothetical protein, partial [Mesorhizobium australicum]|uniref:hypothetical protein n=1 Tax=Mesorhizobium australicum TaxID=536018 RepID=UPI003EBDB26B